MNVLGIILARAGSAGLLNKHLRLLDGRPVIEYTFDHAANSRRLSAVCVSTDCPQIKQLARSRGLWVIDRPADLATASASVQDAMLHATPGIRIRQATIQGGRAGGSVRKRPDSSGGLDRSGHRDARKVRLRLGAVVLSGGKMAPRLDVASRRGGGRAASTQ